MWTLVLPAKPGVSDKRFFLAPAINRSLDIEPLDEVLFLRGEVANLGTGRRNRDSGPLGGGRDARFAANLLTKTILEAFPVPPPEEAADVPIRYQLG